jgi:hypothetical protein
MQSGFIGVLCVLGLISSPLEAADRKSPSDVSSDELTSQTQRVVSQANKFDLVWWIPIEFWESVFAQDPTVDAATAAEILDSLRPYSMLAVVQADISALGAFEFLNNTQVARGLSVSYVPTGGAKPSALEPLSDLEADLEVMIGVLRPVLAAAIGNMGENMHFFVLPDLDRSGDRLVSPYEFGAVEVGLGGRDSSPPVELLVELPLDALFIPRMCPNGKPAHVTWTHCPWGGEKLAD